MRYMLLMSATEAEWQALEAFPPPDLGAPGELVCDQRLAGPGRALIVQARTGAAPLITTGPFAAARELLAAYWVIDCEALDRAIELAARVSAWPGRGGLPLNLPVEVRAVMRQNCEEL